MHFCYVFDVWNSIEKDYVPLSLPPTPPRMIYAISSAFHSSHRKQEHIAFPKPALGLHRAVFCCY